MLIIIVVGFCITKAGMLTPKVRTELTNIVLYIILPCSIFESFHKGITADTLKQCVVVLIVAFGLQFFYMLLNRFLYVRFTPERRSILKYATLVNNASFIGLPIISSVYGEIGVLYGSIILVPLRIFMWTAGISQFTQTNRKQSIKIVATHPCILAVFLGLAYALIPYKLPAFLSGAIGFIGSSNVAISMLVVGSILSDVDFRHMLDKDCFYYTFFRLLVIPAITFGVLLLLHLDPVTTGAIVLSSAMPAATTAAMLSDKYGADSRFASKLILISTMLSMVTLPVISYILTTVL